MTEKRAFIRHYVCRLAPAPEHVDAAVDRAEAVWERLSARGYGAPKAHEPRAAGVDWYAKLPEAQRAAFDRFWKAYGYKKDKAGAAMRWYQLTNPPRPPLPKGGEKATAPVPPSEKAAAAVPPFAKGGPGGIPATDIEHIIQAAAAEAKQWRDNPPPGQTRIYAQGWLQARRWEDHDTGTEGVKKTPDSVERANLVGKINGLKQLYAAAPNASLQQQIAELEAKLRG